jgi:hypothetical protein
MGAEGGVRVYNELTAKLDLHHEREELQKPGVVGVTPKRALNYVERAIRAEERVKQLENILMTGGQMDLYDYINNQEAS